MGPTNKGVVAKGINVGSFLSSVECDIKLIPLVIIDCVCVFVYMYVWLYAWFGYIKLIFRNSSVAHGLIYVYKWDVISSHWHDFNKKLIW